MTAKGGYLRHGGTGKLLAATLAAALAIAAVQVGASEAPSAPSMAVFPQGGELVGANFAEVVDNIAADPELRVYRIALGPESGSFHLADAQRIAAPARAAALADGGAIAVVYPDVGEPYRSVFNRIIEGIESSARMRVINYAVGADRSPADLAEELRRREVRVVIALGRQGLKAASGLEKDIGVIAAGVLSVPPDEARGMSVQSLAPDPALLFARLRTLAPAVRRVHVVYDPRQSEWLVRLAREAARAQGLELVAYDVGDLKAAVRQHLEVIGNADPRREALWLLQDTTAADETTVLPVVLQEAWNRNLMLFSSNVGHVRRGALFALYPNNVELGRNLAGVASAQAGGGARRTGLAPLREVLAAVNVRTAAHLGLDLGSRPQNFDLVFPEQ